MIFCCCNSEKLIPLASNINLLEIFLGLLEFDMSNVVATVLETFDHLKGDR